MNSIPDPHARMKLSEKLGILHYNFQQGKVPPSAFESEKTEILLAFKKNISQASKRTPDQPTMAPDSVLKRQRMDK